jgi:RNA polymerase sigma factor (TIGR02999 family)
VEQTLEQVGEITLLLGKWREGESAAFNQLMPLVYPRLHEIATGYLRRERDAGVLQPTVLVHEFYLRLVNQRKVNWESRRHFYTFAARLMRMILIDHAREVQARIRGGDLTRIPLSEELAWVAIDSVELIDLNRVMEELAKLDERKVRLVELRCFLGCTAEETAELMEISTATVDREMRFIRSWLYRQLYPDKVQQDG